MVDYQQVFHVGVRVADLDAAMAELGAGLGLTWAAPAELDQSVWTPRHGVGSARLRFTYSVEGPQHVELVEGQAGSLWDGRTTPGVHHSGVWVDDIPAEVARLGGLGWSLVASHLPPEEHFGGFAYLAPPTGMVVELVSSSIRPLFERWWTGGRLFR